MAGRTRRRGAAAGRSPTPASTTRVGAGHGARALAVDPGVRRLRRAAPLPAPVRGAAAPGAGRRAWLTLDGIFYEGDVWLDGAYLGDTEGYFFPHTFEVTERAAPTATEHVLAVEVGCARPADRTAKRNLTGVFQHWDCLDPDWNPGGIWRPVRVSETGPVRIARARACCAARRRPSGRRSTSDAVLDAGRARSTCGSGRRWTGRRRPRQSRTQTLAAGANRIRLHGAVEQPALWWPHALGDQPLYDVRVDVDVGDDPSPERARARASRTGLRQVRMKNFIADRQRRAALPQGQQPGPVPAWPSPRRRADDLERDVVLARRRRARPAPGPRPHQPARALRRRRPARAAALAGPPPAVGLRAARVRKQAVRQARAGRRPARPPPVDRRVVRAQRAARPRRRARAPRRPRRLARFAALPGAADVEQDRARPLHPPGAGARRPDAAGRRPLRRAPRPGLERHRHPPLLRLVPRRRARLPAHPRRRAPPRPVRDRVRRPGRAHDRRLDGARPVARPRLGRARPRTTACSSRSSTRHVPPAGHRSTAWARGHAGLPGPVIRFHVETLRRLKYRPTGGFCQFCFADAQPAVSWSVLDHERRPKPGYAGAGRGVRAGHRRRRPSRRQLPGRRRDPPRRPRRQRPAAAAGRGAGRRRARRGALRVGGRRARRRVRPGRDDHDHGPGRPRDAPALPVPDRRARCGPRTPTRPRWSCDARRWEDHERERAHPQLRRRHRRRRGRGPAGRDRGGGEVPRRGDHQAVPDAVPHRRGPGRHVRRAGQRRGRLVGVAPVRHDQGRRLPRRPARGRDHVPRARSTR